MEGDRSVRHRRSRRAHRGLDGVRRPPASEQVREQPLGSAQHVVRAPGVHAHRECGRGPVGDERAAAGCDVLRDEGGDVGPRRPSGNERARELADEVVEVQGASTADGGNIVQYTDWNGTNQQWQLVKVG
ncbi:RICIN domain-containing protein [Cellulomonas oligotrophica]|uniref:Ricin B lectin domain-containing protein n=1 Tax=Cellulomonas oligotrophica TaxID=931536 RepID=A0A7Y9FF64_9CELL|nr:RICIN domain-containing protein [Cellulomonas oligotrophica]NYD86199.1 hypothetical protein [Cellulomonas oligotrophica]GIG34288.1 hypothetical protein Col01nite_34470 [Cellulomonas oligotrophica]